MFTDKKMLKQVAPLVLVALKQRGHEVSFLEASDEGYKHRSRVVVNGIRVPFDVQCGTSGWSGKPNAKRTVRVDWLWMSNQHLSHGSVQLKARSFQQSKARPDTFGFNIPKIADHIEHWASEKKRLSDLTKQKDDHLDQWKSVVKLLSQMFPEESKKLKLEATTQGIKVRGLFGHKDVEALLRALAPPS